MDMKEFEKKVDEFIKSFTKEEMIKILKEHGFEVIENEEKGKWKPADEDIYWFRDSRGAIINEFFNCEHWRHNWREKNIPIFEIREECERYWEFRDAVKEKSYEFSREEWTNCDIPKYVIKYLGYTNEFKTGCFDGVKYLNTTYFKTEEDAKYIIDNYKEELLKYWI